MVKLINLHPNMTNKNGFTLIEMLFVLGIVSIILLLSTPLNLSLLEKHQENQFLKTFEYDVLYIQHLASLSNDLTRITFNSDNYSIYSEKSESQIKRHYPLGWTVDSLINRNIVFEYNGNIRNPRTIHMKSKNAKYKIIFPFGKGRYHIEKE